MIKLNYNKYHNKQSGFTFIEALIAVVVAGILLAIGTGSLIETAKNSQLTASINDLVTTIHLARSEATKRSAQVVMCSTDSPGAALPTCGANWNDGWIVFADDNNNSLLDNGETIIQRHDALKSTLEILSEGVEQSITYQPNGFAALAPSDNDRYIVLCATPRDNYYARALLLSTSGRPTVVLLSSEFYTGPFCETS